MPLLFEYLGLFRFVLLWRRRRNAESGVTFALGDFFVQTVGFFVRQYSVMHAPVDGFEQYGDPNEIKNNAKEYNTARPRSVIIGKSAISSFAACFASTAVPSIVAAR